MTTLRVNELLDVQGDWQKAYKEQIEKLYPTLKNGSYIVWTRGIFSELVCYIDVADDGYIFDFSESTL